MAAIPPSNRSRNVPTVRKTITVTSDDVLNGLKFKVQRKPRLVSLWASGAAAGETCGFSVGDREFMLDGAINIELADQKVDVSADQLLFQEQVPPGEYFIPMTSAGADTSYLLVIE